MFSAISSKCIYYVTMVKYCVNAIIEVIMNCISGGFNEQ